MASEEPGRRSAKILYRPVSMVGSVVGGLIAGRLVKRIYTTATRGERSDAPAPLESEYSIGQVVLGAVIQAAVFAAVRTLIERGGARVFQRWSGEWPGD